MASPAVYIPGTYIDHQNPLARYLPPITSGIISTWMDSESLSGKLILDPFGATPNVVVEAAQKGGRVIVAANNPIASLLIKVAASPPNPTETRNLLSALAATRIREERLEPHINALYLTSCPGCQSPIHAEAFLWEREANAPFARILHCPHCQTTGEYRVTESDQHHAAKYTPGGLHYARALERVAPLHDPDRVHVEEALNVYPPRAVYALLTIINKLDTLNLDPQQANTLSAMLLYAFDRANTLWPHPVARERPRQLTVPPTYRENNIWLALENAANLWIASEDQPVTVSLWPELPPAEGGICLYEGRIKDLAEELSSKDLSAVLMAFPRPNQAFWSLSALWAGWLWGHAAVEHFKSVLRRRRYDWNWFTTATYTALDSLRPALPVKFPVFGLIGEAEPGYITAVLVAASQAGFELRGITLESKEKQAQIYWQASHFNAQKPLTTRSFSESMRIAGQDFLLARGEPSNYLSLHTAILADLAQQQNLPTAETPSEVYNRVQQEIPNVLNYRQGFLRFGGSEKSLEVGQWWLTEDRSANQPLADRVEIAVVQQLVQNSSCTLDIVESSVYSEFSGLMAPSRDLIAEILKSYGDESESGWQIREPDTPTKRRDELTAMAQMITEMGEKLGFEVQLQANDENSCVWLIENAQPKYIFYISASALLGKYLIHQKITQGRGLIIIPGGRANLVMYKLHHDPRLHQLSESNWQFIKYRQVRQLAASSTLTAENLDDQLSLDPLTYAETQLRMF